MSRFFNVLKEANRLNSFGKEALPPGMPSAATASTATEPVPTAVPIEMPGVFSLGDELIPAGVPVGVFNTKHADLSLDRTARLIPHAVDGRVVEHYRRLRTKIMQQHSVKPFRSLVITSPNPREGKSVTTLNLGLSFAMLSSFKVVVIDGDLRKGSLGHWLGVGDRPGFSNLLDGSANLEDVVLKSDESPMCFVVRGTSKMPPAELLNSGNLAGHMQRLGEHFNLILVDSPPVNLITDTQLLAAGCDAVLLVARAFSTRRKAFEKTVNELAPFRVIGAILNGGTKGPGYSYGYYGYVQ